MYSTIASWLALLAFAAAAAYYYNPNLLSRFLSQQHAPLSIPETERPAAKKQKAKRTLLTRVDGEEKGTHTLISSNEGTITKKRKIVSAPVESTVKATTVRGQTLSLPRDEDDEMSNREFAEQLARAQAGTKLESASTQGASKKARRAAKSGQPNGFESPGISTETSSTGGRDADDDLSPNGSPQSDPVSTAPTSRAGDVSDMLEAPAAKPSTLRLTDIPETKPKAPPKAFEQVMTKKQRQRKAKQEENKAMREESDKVQEAKKQAQLRTARMAAGTSNQTKANTFTTNAWQGGKPSQANDVRALSATAAPLLDTFDAAVTPKPNFNGAVTTEPMSEITNGVDTKTVTGLRHEQGSAKTNALGASSREHRPDLATRSSWADQVNEEEQDTWAQELVQDEKWESVTNKKSNKGKKDSDTSSEASSSLARPAPQLKKTISNSAQAPAARSKPESLNRFEAIQQVGGGGDWEA